jgi:endonuclease-3
MPRTRRPSTDPKLQARQVVKALKGLYPESRCALVHEGAYQLLVATILSAQCTDARVNLVTPTVFARYTDASSLARCDIEELQILIRSTGFFRSKAKSLRAMAERLVSEHGGKVPGDLESLTKLPGVGRKTANVVLGNAFKTASGVVVDTHVKRLAHRMGLSTGKDPVAIERDLMATVPRREWVDLSHRLIEHGRKICIARRPRCEVCALVSICPKLGVVPK